jgi:glyoxylase-like metal-dependent hydrolase (beta-lactamase superfamily II)
MKVHHLNCATFRFPPHPAAAFTGSRLLVGHCLLIETPNFLVLVDSGYGLDCVHRSKQTLGAGRFGAALQESETAVRQLESLGYSPQDVAHIVLTHLDFDHAGGIADFPWATVHVHGPEFRAAMSPATVGERFRYRRTEWAHGPKWAVNELGSGENWFGFEAVRELDGLPPEMLVVPLVGHTRGHAGVAVDTGHGWLLHAGDSYLLGHEIDAQQQRSTGMTRLYDVFGTTVRPARQANLRRLIELNGSRGSDVRIFSAHDPTAFSQLKQV